MPQLMDEQSLSPQFLAQKTWDLYQTHGVPFEVSQQILEERGLKLDQQILNSLIENHQKASQESAKGQFSSGLGEITEKTKALHTTTHILHRVLREMFGDEVKQIGSAITEQKARFDISYPAQSISSEDMTRIEQEVVSRIQKGLHMSYVEISPQEAIAKGAIGLFGEKYGDTVTVYTLQDGDGVVYSREFCSGPHIENTQSIKSFSLLKKKSIGAGQTRFEFDVVV